MSLSARCRREGGTLAWLLRLTQTHPILSHTFYAFDIVLSYYLACAWSTGHGIQQASATSPVYQSHDVLCRAWGRQVTEDLSIWCCERSRL